MSTTPKFCGACGASLAPEDQFCGECGSAIISLQKDIPSDTPPKASRPVKEKITPESVQQNSLARFFSWLQAMPIWQRCLFAVLLILPLALTGGSVILSFVTLLCIIIGIIVLIRFFITSSKKQHK
jgi:hypothetical protein